MDSKDLTTIKALTPFKECGESDLASILEQASIETFQSGKMIFKRDEEDDLVYWILSGSIDLLDEKFEAKGRKADDEAAQFPIDNNNPHRLTAISTENTRMLIIKRSDIGLSLPGHDISNATEMEEEVDWMSTLLSSPLFEFIPPANIQTLFGKFEEIEYDAGDIVISQGASGDYFYVIQSGRVKVERTSGGKTSLLVKLKAGDNFGQDALISEEPRNATVTMMTKGKMMRLSEPDFESLLMHPVIESVSMDEVKEMIQAGDPKTYILDVRNPKEFEQNKIANAINVPLLLLRKNLKKLKEGAVYITACDGGKRSELAAYTLNEKGFTAYVLK
ncbi:MAG: cyclic nucleotide-binding domain-containing protein [Pseudomonadales bacterium]|nr:cyclic nucleotide-binding domain-containing protein [Pseudomonadales bacterium]